MFAIINFFTAATDGRFAQTEYHVGASDSGTEGVFVWCSLDTPSNVSGLIKWKTGQPDNLKNDEHCASITGSSGTPPDNMMLSDLQCATIKKNYLCEAWTTKNICCARTRLICVCSLENMMFALRLNAQSWVVSKRLFNWRVTGDSTCL